MTSLRIALRYLFGARTHRAVTLIARLSMAGVAVATAAIICVLSVFNGFVELADSRLSCINPSFKIVRADGARIGQADSLVRSLCADARIRAAAPVIEHQAFAVLDGRSMPVTIKGIPAGYDSVVDLSTVVIDGDTYMGDDDEAILPGAIIAVGVAVELNAHPAVRDMLRLYVPRTGVRFNPALAATALRCENLRIAGVFETDQNEYDMSTVFIPMESAHRLLGYEGTASAVDVVAADGVEAHDLARIAGEEYRVLDRRAQEDTSFRMVNLEKWISFLMLAFILVVASFNVVSTLCMLVIEKTRDMHTLRALGASMHTIRRIFLYEGILVNVAGGIIGAVVGCALCLWQQATGILSLGGDHARMSVTAYPVLLDGYDVAATLALVIAVGVVVGLIASTFVAHRMRKS